MAEQMTDERRKRIQRLKKLILLILITLLLIPIVLCMVLFIRMQKLQKQVEELQELVAVRQQEREYAAAVEASGQEVHTEVMIQEVEAVYTSKDSEIPAAEVLTEDCRKVYLTFDDGPSRNTDEILDILAQYDVKATFFVVGKTDEKSMAAYRRIVEEGHTLGMHSYSHKYEEVYQSIDSFAQDMGELQELLYEVTGVWSRYLRFPGGSSNTVSQVDMVDLIAYLKEQGIRYYDWNVSSGDASSETLSAETIKENVLRDVGKYDTAIVLMHDAADKPTTVEALPELLEELLAMDNTKILAIDDETVPIQHKKVIE